MTKVKELPGLAKLVEETGELQQVLGKLMTSPSMLDLPGGSTRLVEELGDVLAAMEIFISGNKIDYKAVIDRSDAKVRKARKK